MTEATSYENDQRDLENHSVGFVGKTLITVAVWVAFVLAILFVGYTAAAWLLFFAAVLLAILLRSLSDPLASATGMRAGTSLGLTVLSLVTVCGLVGWFLAARIETQFNEFAEQLSNGIRQAQDYMESYSWGSEFKFDESQLKQLFSSGGLIGNVGGVLSSSLGVAVDVIVVLVLAVYLAIDPATYKRGLIHLLPLNQRTRAEETFDSLGNTLRWWLVGRMLSMLEVGLLTGVGLWLLGIPLPFTLGLITGLMNFVPNFGPALATLLTGLVGLSVSPTIAIYAVVAQIVIGGFDGFVVTPLIQQRTVSLPAGVVLGAQLLIGILLGGLGVMLATPLAATAFVLIKKLYVNDLLGDESVKDAS